MPSDEEFVYKVDPSLTLKHITPWHTTYFQALLKFGVPMMKAIHMTNNKPAVVAEEPNRVAFTDVKKAMEHGHDT